MWKSHFDASAVFAMMAFVACSGCTVAPADSGDAGTTPVATGPKCSPTVTKLASPFDLAGSVGISGVSAPSFAVNGTDVYFALGDQQTGAVLSVPIRGGPVRRVAPIVGGTGWAPNSNLVLTVTMLATTSTFPFDLATDGKNVFFSDVDGIDVVADTGGPVRSVVADTRVAGGLWADEMVVAGSDLLVAGRNDAGTGGAIYRVPMAGGSLTTVATSPWNVSHPVLCGQDVCWWNSVGPAPTSVAQGLPGGNIMQQVPGGTAVVLLQGLTLPVDLFADGKNFYLSVSGDASQGEAAVIPADGSQPIYPAFDGGQYVAIDDECLYSSSAVGIFSVQKP
jgi:hypothetical protein